MSGGKTLILTGTMDSEEILDFVYPDVALCDPPACLRDVASLPPWANEWADIT